MNYYGCDFGGLRSADIGFFVFCLSFVKTEQIITDYRSDDTLQTPTTVLQHDIIMAAVMYVAVATLLPQTISYALSNGVHTVPEIVRT
jgi:hypothetical protein